jgi:hypothetical protein
MADHQEHTPLPLDVVALLGADIIDHGRGGLCRVVSGGGLVAKVGPPEVVAREAAALVIPDLPLSVPTLVDAGAGWFVVTAEDDDEGDWPDADLHGALRDLARLHDAFDTTAGLRQPVEDLDALLLRPFSPAAIEALLAPARRAGFPLPAPLAGLLDDPAAILEAASAEPTTLLHGDPWPGNILRPAPGRRVWVDWELASLGPAAADLASWLGQTPWHTGRPVDGHLEVYLEARSRRIDRPRFERALDAATILWFLAHDVPRLAAGERPSRPACSVTVPLGAAERLLS